VSFREVPSGPEYDERVFEGLVGMSPHNMTKPALDQKVKLKNVRLFCNLHLILSLFFVYLTENVARASQMAKYLKCISK
jgi:hypothetical protein